ncbi:hypothetical protein LG651_08245 [Tamlana sp. 62-3]|uniref:Uncharacterized protein n=1 Tax=Neotamlana sargassicola TaxID=2883125 RepID=A0A9X1I8D3_9FLAO|nr:hypothetical protein [Tamlana sargassicola]MCB4808239.1 hypothetical protein [Tamlana sargassicola]
MEDSYNPDEKPLKKVPEDLKPKVMEDIESANQLMDILNKFPNKVADIFNVLRGKKNT